MSNTTIHVSHYNVTPDDAAVRNEIIDAAMVVAEELWDEHRRWPSLWWLIRRIHRESEWRLDPDAIYWTLRTATVNHGPVLIRASDGGVYVRLRHYPRRRARVVA